MNKKLSDHDVTRAKRIPSNAQNKTFSLLELARYFFEIGNFEKAKFYFEEVSRVEPKNSDALNGLATSLCELNDGKWSDEAMNHLFQALEYEPKNAKAWNNVGDFYYQKEEYEHAAKYFEKALNLCPVEATFHTNLAMTLRQLHKFDAALKVLSKAILLDPENAWIRFQLGMVYVYRGFLNDQMEDFDKASEVFVSVKELRIPDNKEGLRVIEELEKMLKILPTLMFLNENERQFKGHANNDEDIDEEISESNIVMPTSNLLH